MSTPLLAVTHAGQGCRCSSQSSKTPTCCPAALPDPIAVTVTSSSSSRVAATPLQLTALAPSRFLWVEASSGGGSVNVEVVQEGSLTVSTSGGDISVPKVLPPTLHAAGQPLPSGCVPAGGNGCCSGSG